MNETLFFISALATLFVIMFLFAFRNNYTLNKMLEAHNIVYKYVKDLGYKNYNSEFDYYNEMKVSYNKYFFSFWKWGIRQCFKKEYLEVLEKYIKG